MDLKEEKVIITGAASGFGNHLANYLKDKSNKLILIDINPNLKKQFKNEDNISLHLCDLTDFNQTTDVIKEIFHDDSDIRILINNAGIIHSELLINFFNKEDRRHSKSSWDKMLDVNLNSVFNCTVNVADQMVCRRLKGLIINISSISANGNAGQSVYSAAKAAVNALTITWSRELAAFGIRSAGIAPGFFDTPSTHLALKENTLNKILSEIPLRKLGQLDDLAKAVEFIIQNDYYNGKILELDGGLTLSFG